MVRVVVEEERRCAGQIAVAGEGGIELEGTCPATATRKDLGADEEV